MKMDMLTSNGNQYLRPEYLTPLPTTLDAKKSPLALLAQTCSQIGADPPSTKSLLNSLTSSSRNNNSNGLGSGGDHSENERSASSSSSSGNSTSNPGSINLSHSNSSSSKKKSTSGHKSSMSSGVRTPGEKIEKSHSKVNHSLNSNSFPSNNTTTAAEESTRANNSNSGGSLNGTGSGGMSNEKNVTTPEQPDDKGTSRAKTPGSSSNANTTNSNKTTSRTGTPNNIPIATTTTNSLGNTSPGSTSTNPGNKSPLSALSSSNTTTTGGSTRATPPDTFMSKSHESSSSNSSHTNRPSRSPTSATTTSKDKLNLTGPDLSPLSSSALLSNNNKPSSLVPFPGLYPGLPPPSLPPSSACHPGGSAIPPYLHSYARLKAAAAAGNLGSAAHQQDHHGHSHGQLSSPGGSSSGCRDPFCTGCQLGAAGHLSSLAAAGGGKCPAGCISCDHHKTPVFSAFPPLFPGFPHLPPSLASLYSSVHQSNAAAAAAAAAASSSLGPSSVGQPYVCNWIAGDSYCGKRFSSSEDLLQHLRSHTNLSSGGGGNSEPGTLSSVMDRYGPPSHHLLSSAAAAHNHISRTYPTPPLSPLSSARFHPYSKPGGMGSGSGALSMASMGSMGSLGLGQLPGSFPQGFGPPPGFSALAAAAAAAAAANNPLNPYYPYSLYGQRLGASGLGHP